MSGGILILKPSSLGDVVHTLPGAALLRRAFPGRKIRWLVNTEWAPLLDGNPDIDEVIEFPRRDFRGVRGALRIAPWARRLREQVEPDLVLDYQGLLRSALIAKLCRSEGCRVFGLSDAREGARLFYDQAANVSGIAHAVDRYLALSRHAIAAGGGVATPSAIPLSWPLPPGVPPSGFDEKRPFVLLHPFSRGAGKSLEQEEVGALCAALSPIPVVIAGRSNELVPPADNVLDLLNCTNLHSLIWLLRHAAFVVSVDSGPMHIASALDVPLVSIHTWSDPAKVGPYREDAWVWKEGRLFQQRERSNPDAHLEVHKISGLGEFIRKQLESCA